MKAKDMTKEILLDKIATHIDLVEGVLENLVSLPVNGVGDTGIVDTILRTSNYILSSYQALLNANKDSGPDNPLEAMMEEAKRRQKVAEMIEKEKQAAEGLDN